jgi:hypothetical protein
MDGHVIRFHFIFADGTAEDLVLFSKGGGFDM